MYHFISGKVKHCVKSVHIRSYSDPHFPAFGLNNRIQSDCGKMETRLTPNTDTFYAVKSYGPATLLKLTLIMDALFFIDIFADLNQDLKN